MWPKILLKSTVLNIPLFINFHAISNLTIRPLKVTLLNLKQNNRNKKKRKEKNDPPLDRKVKVSILHISYLLIPIREYP